ncbi:ATP-binding protein [Streptosporangium sandarakinum]|uniref:ATP-binding protein n=1 Tax=Streptosporangium sandarakinum TaxID=1260955 RepID=UPI00342FD745
MKGSELLGHIALPGDAASVPQARRYVRDLLEAAGHPRTDDALLLVTELVTNAVRHSDSGRQPDGKVTLIIMSRDGTILIDVIDEGSPGTAPELRTDVQADCGGGRGLWLVRELSTAWGWRDDQAGRVVWFQIAENDREPAHA